MMAPDLTESRRLLARGLHLVPLEKNSKKPEGDRWNHPSRRVKEIDDAATGYGLPLALNNLCSVDPDRADLAPVGLAALGFDLETIMSAGVRTVSTRTNSGGRSAFRDPGALSWLKFTSPETGTVMEFRAKSANLQDTIPGIIYYSKGGEVCSQKYANCKRLDEAPELPADLLAWWAKCSENPDYLHAQQRTFFEAIAKHLGKPIKATLSLPSGTALAFPAPGSRTPFNEAHDVVEILTRHGYTQDDRTGRWAPSTATGAASVREIPGTSGLWQSDHASDPLHGTFDAWIAYVRLDHGDDVAAAVVAWSQELTRRINADLDSVDMAAALAEIPDPVVAVVGNPISVPSPSDLPFFLRDGKGRAKPVLSNAEAALLNAYTSGGIRLAYDQFRDEIMISERPMQWRAIKDVDAVKLRIRFETMQDPIVGVGRETMRDAISAVAEDNQFDSAQLWVRGLKWDGVKRIGNFFSAYFGTEDSEYSRACSKYFWTGHIGRILVPGIQADMAVILTGAQGRRKSSGLRALCPSPEFFVEINLATNPTDLARLLRGTLIAELAELSGLRSREIEHTKAFIARTHEDWVPKFKEHSFKYARRNLFTGTTNEDEFLDDSTGARRFLPLRVSGWVDVDAIKRDREQLWAEAVVEFDDGIALGEDGIQWQDAERLARGQHDEFTVTDPWSEAFVRWLAEREDPEAPFTAVTAIQGAVSVPIAQVSHAHKKRAAGILKRLGYVDGLRYIDGHRARAWFRNTSEQAEK